MSVIRFHVIGIVWLLHDIDVLVFVLHTFGKYDMWSETDIS